MRRFICGNCRSEKHVKTNVWTSLLAYWIRIICNGYRNVCKHYRQNRIKAAMHVNKEMLRFYWDLGRDIVGREEENRYGSKFYATLSRDLRHLLPDAEGLSERSLRYTKKFYLLYNEVVGSLLQLVAQFRQIYSVCFGDIICATFFKEILPIYPKNLSSLYSKTMCIVR